MKIVVAGGSGLIGTKLVKFFREQGHSVTPVSRRQGVNAFTGEGLAAALAGAQVVVDVLNLHSPEDQAVMEFFTTTTRNLLAAEAGAGVAHHVLLSVVGVDRVPDNGHYRAKVAQEQLVQAARIPYTIVRATQFFEFIKTIIDLATVGETVRLPAAGMQPILADEVVAVLADIALQAPRNGIVELAGPELIRQDELARRFLKATHDARNVVTDPRARYFGAVLQERSLVPGPNARLGTARIDDWLRQLPKAS